MDATSTTENKWYSNINNDDNNKDKLRIKMSFHAPGSCVVACSFACGITL
jgi:hypothetical protein